MLPILYNVPSTERDWSLWSLSHAASHKKIIQAIRVKKAKSLSQYQLDPINFSDFSVFLDNNQQAHNEMLAALGISGGGLQQVDITEENQKRAWVFLHAQEHQDAERALQI